MTVTERVDLVTYMVSKKFETICKDLFGQGANVVYDDLDFHFNKFGFVEITANAACYKDNMLNAITRCLFVMRQKEFEKLDQKSKYIITKQDKYVDGFSAVYFIKEETIGQQVLEVL